MAEAVLLAGSRVIGRFKPLPTGPHNRVTYTHLDGDEDVAVVHDPDATILEKLWAYRHPPGSAEMDIRPVKLEVYEGIGNVYVVDLPDDRTLLVPA